MAEVELTDEHFNLFGRIMYGYASAEFGFKILLSAMLKMDIGIFMVVSEPYSSLQLRNVLKSITKWSTFDKDDEYDKIIELNGRFKSYGKIRNYIAHNRWTVGERPNSIKPVGMNIREGKAVPIGYSDGEKDFTINELIDLANGIFKLHSDLNTFIRTYGYADIIEQKMLESCENIDYGDAVS